MVLGFLLLQWQLNGIIGIFLAICQFWTSNFLLSISIIRQTQMAKQN